MKIEMPVVNTQPLKTLSQCVPTLVQHDATGEVLTVIRGREDTVLFFDADGTITHGTTAYIASGYTILREYVAGETLKITA